jgi:DNA-binding beta-propeller fold protein YncE
VGVITRVAGTVGTAGSAGDDGPATDAQLNHPFGVAVTSDGGFLIGDTLNNLVRKVSADGVITRVAGTTGTSGSAGDDGLATDAQLNGPAGVAVTADGGFLIADTFRWSGRCRRAASAKTESAGEHRLLGRRPRYPPSAGPDLRGSRTPWTKSPPSPASTLAGLDGRRVTSVAYCPQSGSQRTSGHRHEDHQDGLGRKTAL